VPVDVEAPAELDVPDDTGTGADQRVDALGLGFASEHA
jgi:hypothetical protein